MTTLGVQAQIERSWRLANARQWSEFAKLLHPDVHDHVPQTREHVRGREVDVDFNATWPGDWRAELVTVLAEAPVGFSQIRFWASATSTSPETGLTVFRLQDGLIHEIEDHWPMPYEPPSRHCRHVERS